MARLSTIRPTSRTARGLLLVAAAFALGACGGDDGDDPPAEPTPAPAPPAPEPEEPTPPPADPTPEPTPPATPPLASVPTNIDGGPTVGEVHWPNGNTSMGGLGQAVAGISCGVMVENYHVHSHVSIVLNGTPLAFPDEVGFVELSPTSSCYYNIHTHDLSGKIHVEGPEPATYTLGQLFAIWGQPLERNNIAGLMGLPVVVYVTDDGVVTEYTGELADIELLSHRLITIQVGTALTEIPNITWTGN